MNGTCFGLLRPNSACTWRVFSVVESVMNSLADEKTLSDTTRLIYATPLIEIIAVLLFVTCCLMWMLMTWPSFLVDMSFCDFLIVLGFIFGDSQSPQNIIWKHLGYIFGILTVSLNCQMSRALFYSQWKKIGIFLFQVPALLPQKTVNFQGYAR